MQPKETTPVRLALCGAGIFMKDAHIPSIARLNKAIPEQPPFEVVAVYSRTEESAKAAVDAVKAANLPVEGVRVLLPHQCYSGTDSYVVYAPLRIIVFHAPDITVVLLCTNEILELTRTQLEQQICI